MLYMYDFTAIDSGCRLNIYNQCYFVGKMLRRIIVYLLDSRSKCQEVSPAATDVNTRLHYH